MYKQASSIYVFVLNTYTDIYPNYMKKAKLLDSRHIISAVFECEQSKSIKKYSRDTKKYLREATAKKPLLAIALSVPSTPYVKQLKMKTYPSQRYLPTFT